MTAKPHQDTRVGYGSESERFFLYPLHHRHDIEIVRSSQTTDSHAFALADVEDDGRFVILLGDPTSDDTDDTFMEGRTHSDEDIFAWINDGICDFRRFFLESLAFIIDSVEISEKWFLFLSCVEECLETVIAWSHPPCSIDTRTDHEADMKWWYISFDIQEIKHPCEWGEDLFSTIDLSESSLDESSVLIDQGDAICDRRYRHDRDKMI